MGLERLLELGRLLLAAAVVAATVELSGVVYSGNEVRIRQIKLFTPIQHHHLLPRADLPAFIPNHRRAVDPLLSPSDPAGFPGMDPVVSAMDLLVPARDRVPDGDSPARAFFLSFAQFSNEMTPSSLIWSQIVRVAVTNAASAAASPSSPVSPPQLVSTAARTSSTIAWRRFHHRHRCSEPNPGFEEGAHIHSISNFYKSQVLVEKKVHAGFLGPSNRCYARSPLASSSSVFLVFLAPWFPGHGCNLSFSEGLPCTLAA